MTVPDEGEATGARIRAAGALRRLGHALVSHQSNDDVLDRLAADAERAAFELEGGRPHSRPVDTMKHRVDEQPPADGAGMGRFPDCVVVGQANPIGVTITMHREGDDAAARVWFGPGFEGAPGRAHGGVVAAVFGDTLWFVLSTADTGLRRAAARVLPHAHPRR